MTCAQTLQLSPDRQEVNGDVTPRLQINCPSWRNLSGPESGLKKNQARRGEEKERSFKSPNWPQSAPFKKWIRPTITFPAVDNEPPWAMGEEKQPPSSSSAAKHAAHTTLKENRREKLKKKKNSTDGRDKAAAQTPIPARKGESDWSTGEGAVTWQQTSAHGHNRLNYLQIIFGSTTHFESSQKASCAAAPDWLLGQSRSCRALYWSCKKKIKKNPPKTNGSRHKEMCTFIHSTNPNWQQKTSTDNDLYRNVRIWHMQEERRLIHTILIFNFFLKNELQEKAANSGPNVGDVSSLFC